MKTIVFDFDGTLADTEDLFLETAEHILGRSITEEDLKQYRLLTDKEFLEYLGIGTLKALFYYRKGKKYFQDHADSIQLFDGMKQLLHSLSPSCTVGVVSKNEEDIIKPIIERSGIKQYIDFVHHSSFWKSKESTLLHLKDRYDEMVYVGDQVGDIEAAHSISIPCIGVTWGHHVDTFLQEYNPEYLVESVTELGSVLQSLCDRKSPSN